MSEPTKICGLGAGDVGGPTMAMVAHQRPDIDVHVADLNPKRVATGFNL